MKSNIDWIMIQEMYSYVYAVLFAVFLFALCTRKIADKFMKISIFIMVVAISIRYCLLTYLFILEFLSKEAGIREGTIHFRLQFISFEMPFYAFQIMLTGLVFSANQFYWSVKKILFVDD